MIFPKGAGNTCTQRYALTAPPNFGKISSETDRDIVEDCRNSNTTRDRLHEENSAVPGGIWISEGKDASGLWFRNDRIIHKWLTCSGRYHLETVDRHLSAIRYCEKLTGGNTINEARELSSIAEETYKAVTEAEDPTLQGLLCGRGCSRIWAKSTMSSR